MNQVATAPIQAPPSPPPPPLSTQAKIKAPSQNQLIRDRRAAKLERKTLLAARADLIGQVNEQADLVQAANVILKDAQAVLAVSPGDPGTRTMVETATSNLLFARSLHGTFKETLDLSIAKEQTLLSQEQRLTALLKARRLGDRRETLLGDLDEAREVLLIALGRYAGYIDALGVGGPVGKAQPDRLVSKAVQGHPGWRQVGIAWRDDLLATLETDNG